MINILGINQSESKNVQPLPIRVINIYSFEELRSWIQKFPILCFISISIKSFRFQYIVNPCCINRSIKPTIKAHSLKEGVKEKSSGINLGNVQVRQKYTNVPNSMKVSQNFPTISQRNWVIATNTNFLIPIS